MQGVGNCFDEECSYNEAMLTLRMADVIYVRDKIIYPTMYPSEFSDLIEGAVQNNVTLVAHEDGTIIDGKMLNGGLMYYLENQRKFTWGKFKGFTFRDFSKLIMSREHSWSTYPQVVFEDCTFEDNSHDLFSTTGGHWVFVNCVFRNNSGRIFKALSETCVEFEDCTFETSQAAFAYGADIIFRNCIFSKTYGQRGGAIYAAKSTLYVYECKFIETKATANGGAIYIRDSHEKYQSEISKSCFLRTNADMNGTAIYAYLSDLTLNSNIFSGGEESFYAFSSDIHEADNKFNADAEDCIRKHKPMNEPDLYYPCDTYQRHDFDDAHGNIYADFRDPENPLEQNFA
ncbi:polymorphic repeat outer membrane protein [Histomonas meleagridis]|uniref:polymorphic repeat outer membrane protein n=1 Tax=Histomonas meleagridis TaxID=135588 RepID=UPI003559467C|nr:polymorphic repeat outer membrane protein [Histomonas meleagridis]KAH0801804.1 polymorphic repeat outer membrane protein [Histomonas meleagridis]